MLGIHTRANTYAVFDKALAQARGLGCNYVQIFNGKDMTDADTMRNIIYHYNMGLVVHAPYITNMANMTPGGWLTNYLMTDIQISAESGAFGYVIHIGTNTIGNESKSLSNVYTILRKIAREAFPINIYLETLSGQGGELCYTLEDLAVFYKKIKYNRLMKNIKICIDTCHVFAAGYDIRTIGNIKKFIDKFDKLIGIRNVGLVHLNDSANEIGTHKDRHAPIGRGYIGIIGLKYLFDYFSRLSIPCILEIPESEQAESIKILTGGM